MSTPLGRVLAFATIATVVCFLAMPHAAAQSSSASRTFGIATINSQELLSGTIEGKRAIDSLNQRFAPKQAALKQQQQEIETLENQLSTRSSAMTAVQRERRMTELEEKKRTLDRNMRDAQVEYDKTREQMLAPINSKMLRVLESYVQSHGYVLLVDTSAQGGIIWAAPATDITKDVIRAYDAAP